MTVHVDPLLASYALVAGNAILKRVHELGKLPADLREEYDAWRVAHAALGAVPASDTLGARTLDAYVDRTTVVAAHICDAIIDGYTKLAVVPTASQARRLADAKLVRGVFTDDLRDVVRIPYADEWKAVGDVLARLTRDGVMKDAVRRLGLDDDLALCRAHHALYGEALGVANASADARAAAIREWNAAFAALLVAATAHENKKVTGVLAAIEAPYEEQLGRQRAAGARVRQRRAKAKVEGTAPVTGGASAGGRGDPEARRA